MSLQREVLSRGSILDAAAILTESVDTIDPGFLSKFHSSHQYFNTKEVIRMITENMAEPSI